ncbi:MAG TPA: PilZ domain-containing protein [Acidimicrobiales bacterium]|nr:PilZ domain-containing protein [Acidimicrobiales bacterium]
MPVSVQLQGWRSPLACSLVRVDEKSKQILLALPDNVQVAHKAESGESAVIGWPGHSVWHESRTSVSGKMKPGSKFFWLRLTSVPIHNERRRFVRAHQVRPISIHSGRDRVRATTMDVSEAALRVVMGQGDPIHSGDKVHMLFNTMQRHLGSIVSLAIDGHVYRTRELGEGSAGRKEVVIFFENLSPSQEDFIRGLVYDMDLQHKKPNTEEE